MQKNKIIPLALNISEAAYAEYVYNRGLDWIQQNMSLNMEEVVYTIAKSKLFWIWWRIQWNIRDEQFCREINILRQELPLDGDALKVAKELYNETHAVRSIKAVPSRFVREDITKHLKARIVVAIEDLNRI
ncbi:MAG: hypothetical protein JNK73_13030 [Bacteroidia bacterium]|nr:hypothetical protein [Bacteroidia bacterium]